MTRLTSTGKMSTTSKTSRESRETLDFMANSSAVAGKITTVGCGHDHFAVSRATSAQSLSPRPEKHNTTTSSFFRFAATFIVSTTA